MLIASALEKPMDTRRSQFALTIAGELPGIECRRVSPTHSDAVARRSPRLEGPAGSAKAVFAGIYNPTRTQILAETQYPAGHPEQAKDAYTVFTGEADTATDTTHRRPPVHYIDQHHRRDSLDHHQPHHADNCCRCHNANPPLASSCRRSGFR